MNAEEIFEKWGRNVDAYPQKALQDFDIGMKIIERNAYDVKYLSPELRDNFEIAKKVVSLQGETIKYLPNKWKDNEEIVSIAFTHSDISSMPFMYASDRLKDDKALALEAVAFDGNNLIFVSNRLKDDEEVVDTAIKNNPLSLPHASDRIKHIEKYALLLFKQENITNVTERYGLSKNIDNRHLSDKSLMKKAVNQNHLLIQFITSKIPGYREVIKELSKEEAILYWVKDRHILDDKELVCLSLQHDGEELDYVSPRLKDDKDVVLTAVKSRGCALRHASKRLQNDLDVANTAILSDSRARAYIGDEIKDLYQDEEIEQM